MGQVFMIVDDGDDEDAENSNGEFDGEVGHVVALEEEKAELSLHTM